jgi:tetratricopeptide (TPR) repeat protein
VALTKTPDKDDRDGAIKAFQKAIAIEPKSGMTHFNLAVVYRQQKRIDDAIPEYQEAVKLDPSLSGAYYDLGLLYSQDRRHEQALDAFRKYLSTSDHRDSASEKDAEERIKSLEAAAPKKK